MGRPTVAVRGVAVLMVVGLAAACSSKDGNGVAPTPTAAGITRPQVWAGAQKDGTQAHIALTTAGQAPPKRLVSHPLTSPELPDELAVEDVSYDPATQRVFLGVCCEPTSGTVFSVDAKADKPKLEQAGRGWRVDVAGGLTARADSSGYVTVGTGMASEYSHSDIGATDVALRGSDGKRLATLIDPARIKAMRGVAPAGEPRLLVEEREAPGSWKNLAEVKLPVDRQYCGVVWLGPDRVGIVKGELFPGNPFYCIGRVMDYYTLGVKRLDIDAVVFDEPVRNVGIDATSTFLIFATARGSVGWMTLDGRAGELADSGYTAVDW
jgi:hypothetical protein